MGANFAQRARRAGHAMSMADISSDADHVLDVGDPAAVASLVAEIKPDAIVHLAAALTDAGGARSGRYGAAQCTGYGRTFRCGRSDRVWGG